MTRVHAFNHRADPHPSRAALHIEHEPRVTAADWLDVYLSAPYGSQTSMHALQRYAELRAAGDVSISEGDDE